MAPEVLTKTGVFSTKSDIFSIGSLFFNLLTGRTLFFGRNYEEMLHANMYQNPIATVKANVSGVSAECKNLIIQMV